MNLVYIIIYPFQKYNSNFGKDNLMIAINEQQKFEIRYFDGFSRISIIIYQRRMDNWMINIIELRGYKQNIASVN